MILLTHFDDGAKQYHDLGESCLLVSQDSCKEKFGATLEKWFGNDLPKHREETHGFITWANGSKQEPLYKGFKYYLLSNDGQVIKDLSFN